MKYSISLFVLMLSVWFLWSGHTAALLVGLGVVSVLFVLLVVRRMGVVDSEGVPLGLLRRFPVYFVWLFWQVVKANVAVALCILNPRMPISPRIIHVTAGQKDDPGRVIYANSITLTPGTVSLETRGARISVHALTREAAEDLESGAMDRKVRNLEGSG